MSLQVKVPIRTAVIEANSDCKISGRYVDEALVIRIDTRREHHRQRLGLRKDTRLYWEKNVRIRGAGAECFELADPLPGVGSRGRLPQ
jgi:hypothetical protein